MTPNNLDDPALLSPFYRVAGKAIVRDNAGRILVVCDHTGTYELPGGGWEHDEEFTACIRREIKEELGVDVASVDDSALLLYRGRGARGTTMLRIAASAELQSHDFTYDEVDVTGARFVNREEFITLNWCDEDREVAQYADKLWPPVEKKPAKR